MMQELLHLVEDLFWFIPPWYGGSLVKLDSTMQLWHILDLRWLHKGFDCLSWPHIHCIDWDSTNAPWTHWEVLRIDGWEEDLLVVLLRDPVKIEKLPVAPNQGTLVTQIGDHSGGHSHMMFYPLWGVLLCRLVSPSHLCHDAPSPCHCLSGQCNSWLAQHSHSACPASQLSHHFNCIYCRIV